MFKNWKRLRFCQLTYKTNIKKINFRLIKPARGTANPKSFTPLSYIDF